MEKILDEWIIWSVAHESIFQESAKVVLESLNPLEDGNSPENANEQE